MMDKTMDYSGYDRIIGSIIWFLIAAILLSFSAPAFADPNNSERSSMGHYQDVIQALPGVFCALRMDGTVSVVETCSKDGLYLDEGYEQFKENVERWTDIQKIVTIGAQAGVAGIIENGDVVLELIADDVKEIHGGCTEWHGIKDIISDGIGTFGLKNDGRVITTEGVRRYFEKCYAIYNPAFDSWKDIVTIKGPEHCLGGYGFFGLSKDGVLYHFGWSVLNDWNGLMNIADVEGITDSFLALREDGTVYTGTYDDGMNYLKDIVQIGAGSSHAAAIKSDGTVLVSNNSIDNRTEELDWSDVVSIYWGLGDILFGVCKDGTVKCHMTKNSDLPYVDQDVIESWNGIVRLSVLWYYGPLFDTQAELIVIGYKEDGSIVSTRDLSL